ncbi:MAG: alpha-1,2-fucosyltransferase [Anaerosacchariphilus sp.]
MNIVKIMGGLGNQMFQYALYYKFMREGIETKIDLSYYTEINSHNGYEIQSIFMRTAEQATQEECKKLAFYKTTKWNRLLIRIIRRKSFYSNIYTRESGYDQNILKLRDTYIEGYFQSERYFEDIKEEIKKLYDFGENLPDNVIAWKQQIEKDNSVSIHIRRGDYSVTGQRMLCDTDYYKNAIEYIKRKTKAPIFYIFSNDIEWCKKKFVGDEFRFVTGNTGQQSYWDMFLMSKCNHNIIADSSFSWWGAWLNNNVSKIVMAPEKWEAGNNNFTDIIPLDWIQIKE